MVRKKISVKVLPGEPLDGSGIVCIHLFVQDTKGNFVEAHTLHPVLDVSSQPLSRRVESRPARGRLACNPRLNPASVTRNGVVSITHRSDDPQVVTCPRCKQSKEYKAIMKRLEERNAGSASSPD